MNWAFFGTDEFSQRVLAQLSEAGWQPKVMVTKKLILIPAELTNQSFDFFLVASYGKIIPGEILNLPRAGVLNIHPSLLPRFRGATPIQSTILAGDEETGVTLMQIDEEIDHGPIVAQEKIPVGNLSYLELRDRLADLGAALTIKYGPAWLAGQIKPQTQDHSQASYTQKIKKTDGAINLTDPVELNDRKFRAFNPWPGVYFFTDRNGRKTRVLIKAAHLAADQFVIDRVVPEGKKEMLWADFNRGFKN